MSDDDKFDRFMQRVLQRPLPNDSMARVRILAKELAAGALEELWNSTIFAPYRRISDEGKEGYHPQDVSIQRYLTTKWNNTYPNLQLLKNSGFLHQSDKSNFMLNQQILYPLSFHIDVKTVAHLPCLS
jgi:hypothetical protein